MSPSSPVPEELWELHVAAGKRLFQLAQGDLFPCDALALGVLDRSLSLARGFEALTNAGSYAPAMAVLRMQIDNLLRLRGVLGSGDAHGVANRVINGEHLRKMKDRNGRPMTDQNLLEALAPSVKGIKQIYEQCSGYVHLSSQHVEYFLARSGMDADGRRQFAIGDEDDHVPEAAKLSLKAAFGSVTRAVPRLVDAWCEVRGTHGTNRDLKSRFGKVGA